MRISVQDKDCLAFLSAAGELERDLGVRIQGIWSSRVWVRRGPKRLRIDLGATLRRAGYENSSSERLALRAEFLKRLGAWCVLDEP